MPYIGNQPAPQNVGSDNITDGSITNADINASAAIDITKLSTTVVPTSGATLTGALNFGDSVNANFGAGSDLQIYHNGSNSYISDEGTGDLNIASNGTGVYINKGASENMAAFVTDGAVTLYYDNAAKFATTSVGADVTGELIADSYNETYAAVTSSTNATTVDCEAGNAFSHTLTENTTFTFSNPPASGTAYSFSIEIIQDASASGFTVTWPTSVDWPSGTAPTLTATASAKDVFVFTTRDSGTTWYGFTAGLALA